MAPRQRLGCLAVPLKTISIAADNLRCPGGGVSLADSDGSLDGRDRMFNTADVLDITAISPWISCSCKSLSTASCSLCLIWPWNIVKVCGCDISSSHDFVCPVFTSSFPNKLRNSEFFCFPGEPVLILVLSVDDKLAS